MCLGTSRHQRTPIAVDAVPITNGFQVVETGDYRMAFVLKALLKPGRRRRGESVVDARWCDCVIRQNTLSDHRCLIVRRGDDDSITEKVLNGQCDFGVLSSFLHWGLFYRRRLPVRHKVPFRIFFASASSPIRTSMTAESFSSARILSAVSFLRRSATSLRSWSCWSSKGL